MNETIVKVIQTTERHWKEIDMPKGTKVDDIYQALKRKGMSKGKAAAIAQSKTGKSLMTGKKPKPHKKHGKKK